MFFEAARRRSPVIANSRATMITTIQAGIQFSPTKAMNAEQTMILSAKGSMRMPKLVIKFRRRAIWPSRKSLMLARQNNTSAIVSWYGIRENMMTRKAAVRTKREMVSLFGRFIRRAASQRLSDQIVIGVADNLHLCKLACRQPTAHINPSINIRSIGFAAGDEVTALELGHVLILPANKPMFPRANPGGGQIFAARGLLDEHLDRATDE